MKDAHRASAERIRSRIERREHDPAEFREALSSIPPVARDAWLDAVLGLGELPDDGPGLPQGCVPYIPCPVDALLRMVEQADVRAPDVFVDLGAGVGRAGAFVQLLTGARVIAIEIQAALVTAARGLADRLSLRRFSCVHGDAADLARSMRVGSVFFLYCPFGGQRLTQVLADLQDISRAHPIRICCVDTPLPPCAWLTSESAPSSSVAIHRSQRA